MDDHEQWTGIIFCLLLGKSESWSTSVTIVTGLWAGQSGFDSWLG
jgi:hypothetical protein